MCHLFFDFRFKKSVQIITIGIKNRCSTRINVHVTCSTLRIITVHFEVIKKSRSSLKNNIINIVSMWMNKINTNRDKHMKSLPGWSITLLEFLVWKYLLTKHIIYMLNLPVNKHWKFVCYELSLAHTNIPKPMLYRITGPIVQYNHI